MPLKCGAGGGEARERLVNRFMNDGGSLVFCVQDFGVRVHLLILNISYCAIDVSQSRVSHLQFIIHIMFSFNCTSHILDLMMHCSAV